VELGERQESVEEMIAEGIKAGLKTVGKSLNLKDETTPSVEGLAKDVKLNEGGKENDRLTKLANGPTRGNSALAEQKSDMACDKAAKYRALGLTELATTYDSDCERFTRASEETVSQDIPVEHKLQNTNAANDSEDSANAAMEMALGETQNESRNEVPMSREGPLAKLQATAVKPFDSASASPLVTKKDLESLKDSMMADMATMITGHAKSVMPQVAMIETAKDSLDLGERATSDTSRGSLAEVQAQMDLMQKQLSQLKKHEGWTDSVSDTGSARFKLRRQQSQQRWHQRRWDRREQYDELGNGLNQEEGVTHGVTASQLATLQEDVMAREAAIVTEEKKVAEEKEQVREEEQEARIAKEAAQQNNEASERLRRAVAKEAEMTAKKANDLLSAAKAEATQEEIQSHRFAEEVKNAARDEAAKLTQTAMTKVAQLESAEMAHVKEVEASADAKAAKIKERENDFVAASQSVIEKSKMMHAEVATLKAQMAKQKQDEVRLMAKAEAKLASSDHAEVEVAKAKAAAEVILNRAQVTMDKAQTDAITAEESAKSVAEEKIKNAAEKAEAIRLAAENLYEQKIAHADAEVAKAERSAHVAKQNAELEAASIKEKAAAELQSAQAHAEIVTATAASKAEAEAQHILMKAEKQASVYAAKTTEEQHSVEMKAMQDLAEQRDIEAKKERMLKAASTAEKEQTFALTTAAKAKAQHIIEAAKLAAEDEKKRGEATAASKLQEAENRISEEIHKEKEELRLENEQLSAAKQTANLQAENTLADAKEEAARLITQAEEKAAHEIEGANRIAAALTKEAKEKGARATASTISAEHEPQSIAKLQHIKEEARPTARADDAKKGEAFVESMMSASNAAVSELMVPPKAPQLGQGLQQVESQMANDQKELEMLKASVAGIAA